ncbi:hypothetical protein [Arthrobacter sp. DR-2P]|nr:hypothetical protein [Arthrobacter sp. DR-2P]
MGFIGANAANAGYSGYGYYGPVYGYNYGNYSGVFATDRTYAVGGIFKNGSGTVPVGYMQVNARLFLATGELCKESGFYYNDVASSGLSVPTQGSGCALPSYYYGYAVTASYNGGGYSYYYAPRTENIPGV